MGGVSQGGRDDGLKDEKRFKRGEGMGMKDVGCLVFEEIEKM
jgi:hypothetical protein